MSIYEQMIKNNVPIGSHESDLYAKVTPMSTLILQDYEFRHNVKSFRNNVDGKIWYDVPFAYDPFWDKSPKNKACN